MICAMSHSSGTDVKKTAPDTQVWKIVAVVFFGPFLSILSATTVNHSLSTLGVDLDAPLGTIQWVASGYLLALALMLPVIGWMVDRFGAKRMYLGCFAAFTLASVACGFAETAPVLIGFRVPQGAPAPRRPPNREVPPKSILKENTCTTGRPGFFRPGSRPDRRYSGPGTSGKIAPAT